MSINDFTIVKIILCSSNHAFISQFPALKIFENCKTEFVIMFCYLTVSPAMKLYCFTLVFIQMFQVNIQTL